MNINFDFNKVVAVVEDVVGQDVIQARLNANAYREMGLQARKTANFHADEAKMYKQIATDLTAKAKEVFKAHTQALEKSKVETKSLLTIAHDHSVTEKVTWSYDAMAKELWRQIAEELDMTEDVSDLEVFSGRTCTVVDLINYQVTRAHENEQIALAGECKHRDLANEYFVKSDNLLIENGLEKIVVQGKERAKAKKELEKAVATYTV